MQVITHVHKIQKVGAKEVHMMLNYLNFLAILVIFVIFKSPRVLIMKVHILVHVHRDTNTHKIAI